MQNSFSIQILPKYIENSNPNMFPTSSLIKGYDTNTYQALSSFYPKNAIQKKSSAKFLTESQYQYKTHTSNCSSSDSMPSNKTLYNPPISYKEYSSNINNNKNTRLHKYHSTGNFNIGNIFSNHNNFNDEILNGKKSNISLLDNNSCNGLVDSNFNNNYIAHIFNKNNNPKMPFKDFSEKELLPRQTIHQYNENNTLNTNYSTNFFSHGNISTNYKVTNNILNNALNEINNTESNLSITSSISLNNNLNINFLEEEPNTNFKISDFTILKEIGKGAEGTIYNVRWKKNGKNYAMKKCEIIFDEEAKKKKSDMNKLKEFIESTGCDGVIRIYGNLCSSNHFGTNYYYELMELAEKEWDKEIEYRGKNKLYYQEYELIDIFSHLIKTFSALQSIHFTHRDINPQNIMKANGRWKICDFGNSKILKRDGIIIQKIRGSEIFMSPIVFKGYHSGVQTIKHNTFKSDVFSLGMCFFLAASLNYDALNVIREIYDMNIIKKILNKYLGKRYSQNLIRLLLEMLQVEERKRPDFKQLELFLSLYINN